MAIFSVFFVLSGMIIYQEVNRVNSKRDKVIYISLMIIAFAFAIFYFRDTYQKSLIEQVINIINN